MPTYTVQIPLRIIIVNPPESVAFSLEDNKGNLIAATLSTGDDIILDFEATVRPDRTSGDPNFTGPFARGTPAKRFFYVNIGKRAGQPDSIWNRRAKVPIKDVTWDTIETVTADPGKVLMARYQGTDKKGEPGCATVPLLGGGWVIADSSQ